MPTRRAISVFVAGALLTLCVSATALAQIPSLAIEHFKPPADPRWKVTTIQDLNAAYRLLRDNHPGAVAELHDADFMRQLDAGRARALARAERVDSYQGYLAVLAGFAVEMGDKHIWSRPTFVVNLPRWPQMLVSKRGDAWVVTDTEPSQASLLNASLISCDGLAAEDFGRKNLGGFRVVWSVGAQQVQSAPWLFVDEGNPFIARPNQCIFEQNGQQRAVKLQWVQIKRERLLSRVKQAVGVGAAGFGVRKVSDGYWIALQDLMSDQAIQAVRSVQQQKSVLREARFVVLDLRGNGGGSSELGRQIAAALLGDGAVTARLGALNTGDCGDTEVFRATPGNLEQLEYMKGLSFAQSTEMKKLLDDEISAVRAALAQGRALSSRFNCGTEPKPANAPQAPSLM
jgi:hypothetical protein